MADRSARLLERALLFTFVVHGLGMLSMALVLLPGMPGGGTDDGLARMRYVAENPWLWRLGWFPWQLTALSDVLLGAGLVRARFVPKTPAVVTMVVTLAAVIPDQAGQVAWMTRGIALARAGNFAQYLAYEARIFPWTAYWGGTLYTVGALGWTWCLVAGKAWSRSLTVLSSILWPLFFYVNATPFLPVLLTASPRLVAAGNAIGFVLLELWFALVTEQVLRRSRPSTTFGRYAKWSHPNRALGLIADAIANSRFLRTLTELLPTIAFASEVTDVVYVNYVVDAAKLRALVPEGLELQTVGKDGQLGIFSFLTFRHGHLGPKMLGPLRRLLPSPIHSNWRVYVRDPRSGQAGVYFTSNAIDSSVHALGARMMCEGMPMHVFARANLEARGTHYALRLDGGTGTAPDANADLALTERRSDGPWSAAFGSFDEMLAYVVPQDRALSTQPWHDRVTRQEIRLGIALDACEPLEGPVTSRAARAIVGDAEPFCFLVRRVPFRFDAERYDPLPAPA
jgi:hypothetical protein